MIWSGMPLTCPEKYRLPVLLRITTRLAHSRAAVQLSEARKQNKSRLPSDLRQFVLLPAIARKHYQTLTSLYETLKIEPILTQYNILTRGKVISTGIVACGIAYNYLLENIRDSARDYNILSVAAYPLSKDSVEELANRCERVLVLERRISFHRRAAQRPA